LDEGHYSRSSALRNWRHSNPFGRFDVVLAVSVGYRIVSMSSSVPELFASVAAALKKQSDMVVGNVLGSCIFNILFTIGITSLILPVPMDQVLNQIVLFTLAVIAVISAFVWFGRSHAIGRVPATGMLAVYIAQSVWAAMSG
jgi:cation:H+ antiporter